MTLIQLAGAKLLGYQAPEFPQGLNRLAAALQQQRWTQNKLEGAARQVGNFSMACSAQPSDGSNWQVFLEFDFGSQAVLVAIPPYVGQTAQLAQSPAVYCTSDAVRLRVPGILTSLVGAMGLHR